MDTKNNKQDLNLDNATDEQDSLNKTALATPTTAKVNGFGIVQHAILSTNKHFFGLVLNVSFALLLCICMFVPLWIRYIELFGLQSRITVVFEFTMSISISILSLFMLSFYLFNKVHRRPENALHFWRFTKDISWPWLKEGTKASVITMAGLCLFVVPGVIKMVQYCFVSFVVFFNPDYADGKISALRHSKKLSRGLGWWIVGLLMLWNIIPALPGMILGDARIIIENIIQIGSLWIVCPLLVLYMYIVSLIGVYTQSVLCFMYFAQDKNQLKNEEKTK